MAQQAPQIGEQTKGTLDLKTIGMIVGFVVSLRAGYMGVGFLIAGQWTVEPILFILGFCCVLLQVISRRQWNLVVLQLNGLIAWTIHFINSI